jgi:hypothetical protein
VLTYTTTERGPPASNEPGTTYDAVDRGSHGTSARPDRISPPAGFAYDHRALLVQVARASRATQFQAQGDGGALSSSGSNDVAANAASKLGWGAGDDIYALTKAGNKPAWSTVPRGSERTRRRIRRSTTGAAPTSTA